MTASWSKGGNAHPNCFCFKNCYSAIARSKPGARDSVTSVSHMGGKASKELGPSSATFLQT